MKRSVILLFSISLTACGGSEYFGEASPELSSCLTGTWQEQNLSYPDISRTITYNQDGTYFSEFIRDTVFKQKEGLYATLWQTLYGLPDMIGSRYVVQLEKGTAIADDTLSGSDNRIRITLVGNDLEQLKAQAYADMAVAELDPYRDRSIVMASTHCDDVYNTTDDQGTYLKISEAPLTYENRITTFTEAGSTPVVNTRTVTLSGDKKATLNTSTVDSDLVLNETFDYEYHYSGDELILQPCPESATCANPGPKEISFFDRSTAITESETYFIRSSN